MENEVKKTRPRAQPGNADTQHCSWYSEKPSPRTVVVHLWQTWANEGEAVDSLDANFWRVRKCVVCGTVDTDYLMQQYKVKKG